MATGLVGPDGHLELTQGPLPTITHANPGQYAVTLSGLGTGCPLSQLNPSIGGGYDVFINGGGCGGGSISTTVVMSDSADHWWTYMFVGEDTSLARLRAGSDGTTAIPDTQSK